jgi:hypothetical protein
MSATAHTTTPVPALHAACALVDEAGNMAGLLASTTLPADLEREANAVLGRIRRELQALAGRIESAGLGEC